MKIAIIGGGNMGAAIACGLSTGSFFGSKDISVIDTNRLSIDKIKQFDSDINAVINDYESISEADIIVIAVKPWLVKEVLTANQGKLKSKQIIISIAAGVPLIELEEWAPLNTPIFRLVPNTAIAVKQSMTFAASLNASKEQESLVIKIFSELGKAEMIKEDLIPAATALSSCGIAYAFRYIRAAMEGGVEMGIYPGQARDFVVQTLRGAIDLIEANDSHPEVEIDKVTTAGGITIKGLNEMEHAGFSSAVIKGLKASNVK
ncbi:pyrroline-5-carboxylate reductase [Dysgonomonas sp. 216]|uniref:pyrroline-5-carboxylate reductase n=1 Tax=Dysgonomonas sp. 216 TaxID=2302934 RepID=UPI0013D6ECEE|nr:pyrroline-5-carboxylate reductase [Dysgonomonas sp. 216]NDW19702.1 pyrroline-5-carboxylate reductase [Dysgonomonas sp. 216]